MQISTTTISDVQPSVGAGSTSWRKAMNAANSSPISANTSPSTLTSRSPRVPLVSTIRQKCEIRVRRSSRRGGSPSSRSWTGAVVTRRRPSPGRRRGRRRRRRTPRRCGRPRRAPAGSCGTRGLGAPAERLDHPLGTARGHVAKAAVRRRVGRAGVDDAGLLGQRDVEHGADVRRVVLAVLVHRDDPVAAGRGHAGQRRGVLAEVAAEPDRADEVVLGRQLAHHPGGVVGTVVVDQQHLGHPERHPAGGDDVAGEREELGEDRGSWRSAW